MSPPSSPPFAPPRPSPPSSRGRAATARRGAWSAAAATLALGAEGPRYEFETEVLLRAARRGMPVVGVPVDVHYPPVAERVSHYRPWRDTLRVIGVVLKVLAGPAPRSAG